jgi:CRISPR/Cas system-associated exonuclease Cas4 (RecB family)
MLETGRHELIILETEHFIGTRLQAGDAGQIIYLGGFADRIDELDGEVRIIDYKTGVVNDKFLKINAPAEILEKEKMGKTLQLLMYKYLARDTYPSKTMRPGIISLRTPSKGLFELIIEKEGMDETEAFFQAMVNDLIDPEKPFQKTEDIRKCKYCDFQTLCNRQE